MFFLSPKLSCNKRKFAIDCNFAYYKYNLYLTLYWTYFFRLGFKEKLIYFNFSYE